MHGEACGERKPQPHTMPIFGSCRHDPACYRSAGKLRAMKRLMIFLCSAGLFLAAPGVRAELPDPVRFSVALEVGDMAAATRWLDAGLDPDFEGDRIGTGLMIGAWEGNLRLMELFHARGADIHKTNRFGETALMLAAWKNRTQAVLWLLERGARPNPSQHPDPHRREWTALHYAAFAGHAELLDRLIAAGADVNARSTNGSTVVMMAAREGHAAIARRLLAAGANPALKNERGEDAIIWAMRHRHYSIAQAFTDAPHFAELARQSALAPPPPPRRSIAAPDKVEELLRMARLAEARGHRAEALAVYRQALATLKASEQKVDGGGTGGKAKATNNAPGQAPRALVIRAQRQAPERQTMRFDYAGSPREPAPDADTLIERARAAEAAGRRQEALQLYRQAAALIRHAQ